MRRLRGRGRVAAINIAGAAGALVVVALVAEGWARSKAEFRHSEVRHYMHPRAGRLYVPGSEVRWTNMLDYWTVSRVNRWGFLDRPPLPAPEPSCRVAVIGDSFVTAREVAVSDKLHVRFEEMARSRLAPLRVSASAYGHPSTGQINQLGFYDEFVSGTSPHIVVLVFVRNDFNDNFTGPRLWVTATRRPDRTLKLLRPLSLKPRRPQVDKAGSYALALLASKYEAVLRQSRPTRFVFQFRHPGWELVDLPAPDREHVLESTKFALDQWKARARRDNFLLVAFASHAVGDWLFEQLDALVSARDIPIVYQRSYIRRLNAEWRDGHFAHDGHWNATGHQWAAEALLEWLEQNQAACPGASGETVGASANALAKERHAGRRSR